jgi:hypothetical protein
MLHANQCFGGNLKIGCFSFIPHQQSKCLKSSVAIMLEESFSKHS